MVANTVGNAKDLVNNLLESGYTAATEQVLRALLRNHTTGIMQQRMDELNAEAKRLADEGKKLTPDNAVFRAVMADFEATLKRDAGAVNGASGDVQAAGVDAGGILARQLSLPGFDDAGLAAIGIRWNRPDPEAINSVVNYINTPEWQNEIAGFGDELMDAMLNTVLGGIAEGQSPLLTARDLIEKNQTLPLWKANNILRTLQLTGYRDSTSLYYAANSDIIVEQVRIGTLDGRICLCCLALHGTRMAVGERVDDHHQGRCTSIGIVRGREWNVQSGEDYWNGLSDAEKLDIAGYANLAAINSGAAKLNDFVQPYSDPVFGQMVREASLKGILGRAAQDFYKNNHA